MLKLLMKMFWWLLQRGWVPDCILRWKIRRSLNQLMYEMDEEEKNYEEKIKNENDFVEELKTLPIAINQTDANDQHYELPADFFRLVLGPRLKESVNFIYLFISCINHLGLVVEGDL